MFDVSLRQHGLIGVRGFKRPLKLAAPEAEGKQVQTARPPLQASHM
jgi:hypothetical protein